MSSFAPYYIDPAETPFITNFLHSGKKVQTAAGGPSSLRIRKEQCCSAKRTCVFGNEGVLRTNARAFSQTTVLSVKSRATPGRQHCSPGKRTLLWPTNTVVWENARALVRRTPSFPETQLRFPGQQLRLQKRTCVFPADTVVPENASCVDNSPRQRHSRLSMSPDHDLGLRWTRLSLRDAPD